MPFSVNHPVIAKAITKRNAVFESVKIYPSNMIGHEIIAFNPKKTPNTIMRVTYNRYIDAIGQTNIPVGKVLEDGISERTVEMHRTHVRDVMIQTNIITQYDTPKLFGDLTFTGSTVAEITAEFIAHAYQGFRWNVTADDITCYLVEQTNTLCVTAKENSLTHYGTARVQLPRYYEGGTEPFLSLHGATWTPQNGEIRWDGYPLGPIGKALAGRNVWAIGSQFLEMTVPDATTVVYIGTGDTHDDEWYPDGAFRMEFINDAWKATLKFNDPETYFVMPNVLPGQTISFSRENDSTNFAQTLIVRHNDLQYRGQQKPFADGDGSLQVVVMAKPGSSTIPPFTAYARGER